MKNKSTILIFLFFVLVGFLTGIGIKNLKSDTDSQDNQSDVALEDSTSIPSEGAADYEDRTQPKKDVEISTENRSSQMLTPSEVESLVLEISKPKEVDGYYSFTATCKGIAEGTRIQYELWHNSKMMKKSANGRFNDVPGVSNGKYKLIVVNELSNDILVSKEFTGFKLEKETEQQTKEAKEEKQLISAAEFQSALLSPTKYHILEGGKGSFVSRNLRITVTNMKSDEVNKPTDIAGIREKIDFEVWRSARVENLEYDKKGYAIGVVISAVY